MPRAGEGAPGKGAAATQLQPLNAQASSKAGKLFCMKSANFKSLRPNKPHLQITSGPEAGHLYTLLGAAEFAWNSVTVSGQAMHPQ